MAAMPVKRASLHTLGCRLNQAETAILGEGLRKRGYQLVEFGEPTDLLVLNTCAVTEDAERTSRYLIRKTLRHSPQAFVAVTGCYAQTAADSLRRQPGIDLVVGHQYKMQLPALLPPLHALEKRSIAEVRHTRTISREDFSLPEHGQASSTRALVKIQDGCGEMCSFCIIPFARGHERSRAFHDVVREVETLVTEGHREVVLTGVNIGRYSQGGNNFCTLLRRLEAVRGLERLRISSIEPTTVTDELLEMMAGSSKICPYLHIPLQSGDDGVLSAMNRRHSAGQYAALVERAARSIKGLGLGTDLMVGFPGETEAAFGNTKALATDLPFAFLHVFPYSPRPGTAAFKFAGGPSASLVKRRSDILLDIAKRARLAFHNRQIGDTVSVLFERGTSDGYRCGTAPNFAKVAVAGAEDLHQMIAPVQVTAATERWALGRLENRISELHTIRVQ
jgi:threonylcarbamoyladenosine tRNA methylthiotransferase MtaB